MPDMAGGEGRVCLGIEIGGTKLQICAGTPDGRIIDRIRIAADSAGGGAGIRRQIEDSLPKFAGRFGAAAAGVGFGGPVDWRSGEVCRSHQIEGWNDFALASWLSSLVNIPVRADNDANVAALAEARSGAGAGRNPVFYITLGSGVGGGLVIDGGIYHGARPGEAEIGHVRLDKSGMTVEERCSGWAIDRRIRHSARPGSFLARAIGPARGHEAAHLGAALEAGDAVAYSILGDFADDLAFGLSHVTHLFHPETIVLGGGLSLLGEPLRAAVAERLPAFTMKVFAPGPVIALAAHGEDAVPAGALMLAGLGSETSPL